MDINQKLEPGVYRVTKSFRYCELSIDKEELLNIYISGDPRVMGGLWYGFKRDIEFVKWFNASTLERFFIKEPKEYNSKYIPIDSIVKVDTNLM